jgi:hypothetical protein
VEDIVAVSALPIGAHWRFRYMEKYVDPAIFAVADSSAAVGIDMLIGISSFDDAPYPDAADAAFGRHLDLLRSATTLSITRFGSLVVVDFELGGYVAGLDASTIASPETRAKLPHRSPDEAPQGWFCLIAPAHNTVKPGSTAADWEAAAAITLRRTSADIVPFAFAMFLANTRRNAKLKSGQLTLQAGTQAHFDLHTLAREGQASKSYAKAIGELKLNVSLPIFTFTSSSTVRLDTHRNVKTISLQSSPAFRESIGHLSLLAFSFRDIGNNAVVSESQTASSPGKSVDREDKRPALVRLDLALSTGKSVTWLFCILAGILIALTTVSFESKHLNAYEWIRIGLIASFTVYGLRKGLSLKG